MTRLRGRFIWVVTLVSLCLITLCTFTAVSLFYQQARLAEVLRENVASRQAAVKLEECLVDLIRLENGRDERAVILHERVQELLRDLREAANEPVEWDLVFDQIVPAFDQYLGLWENMREAAGEERYQALGRATNHLRERVLPPVTRFRLYNGDRLDQTTAEHERVLRRLAWGMAGIGVLGGVAGLVLGFGVARAVSRSIRRLQVQIRDAAGKLPPDEAEVILTGQGGELDEEVHRLTGRIEEVVARLRERDREVLRAEQLAAAGQLAAGVGHEIRNPLTSIKLLVQAGREEGGLSAEDLRVIEGEVRRMERSLQTFLEFARPPKPERGPVDLVAVAGAVLGLVRGRAEKQGVGVRLNAPAGRVVVTADAGQFQQVLVNLVLNALDAMPAGGDLAVSVRTLSGRVEVEVADTGAGVPAHLLPRLFQPFVSGKETGLGLGLVISRRIVEDHGGTVGAANRPGGGASFFVTLPAGGDPDAR